ncbi:glutamine synthetase family protein [Rhodococcus wratislaviensis]|uniref:glutamine synthetase family protein n=1 Tax=Rhodococcus wratislaviensis TaxID=44752 RepID=UPI00364732E4
MSTTPLELELESPQRIAKLEALTAELSKSESVTHVSCQFVTVQARVLAKVMPIKYFLEDVAKNGLPLAYVASGGLQETLDGELVGPESVTTREGILIPDLETFAVLPWDPQVAQVLCTQFHPLREAERGGQVAEADCRANLRRVAEDFKRRTGFELRTGCEPEMTWAPSSDSLKAELITDFPSWVGTGYHTGHLDKMMPIVKRITAYAEKLGFDMVQADYEDPGQLECNFMYDNALATADRLVTYRQICKAVASELDVFATFMPRPIPGIMGNGCHHHASLWKGDENVFASEDDLTEVGRHALGGLLEHTSAMTALFAPTMNSYGRFGAGLLAPTVTNWGFENRMANYRVLPHRVEVRGPDASVNPYLSHAAIMAAMADGIERQIDPGPPAESIADEAVSTAQFPSFASPPKTLSLALDALEKDDVIRAALSDTLLDTFVQAKRDECRRRDIALTDWDYAAYLNYLP